VSLKLLVTRKYRWFARNDRNRDLDVEDSILQPGGFCKFSPVKTDQLYDQYRPFPMRTVGEWIPATALLRLNLMTLPKTSDSHR
jgi:hypothetical protein